MKLVSVFLVDYVVWFSLLMRERWDIELPSDQLELRFEDLWGDMSLIIIQSLDTSEMTTPSGGLPTSTIEP